MSELEGEKDDLLATSSDSISLSLDSSSTQEECPKIADASIAGTELPTAWASSITGNNEEKQTVTECERSCSGEFHEFLDIDLEQQDNALELHSMPISSTLLEDNKTHRVYPFQRAIVLHPPPDFFMLSLFATFCCFMPTGIIAIVKSSQAGKLYKHGMLHEARQVARKARYWIRLSMYIGLGLYIFTGLILCIAFLSHFTNQSDI